MPRTRPQNRPQTNSPETVPGGAAGVLLSEGAATLPPLVQPEPVRELARQDREEPVAEPVVKYRVIRERRIMHRGSMTLLREGKVISAQNYDIPNLMSQGVELQEI